MSQSLYEREHTDSLVIEREFLEQTSDIDFDNFYLEEWFREPAYREFDNPAHQDEPAILIEQDEQVENVEEDTGSPNLKRVLAATAISYAVMTGVAVISNDTEAQAEVHVPVETLSAEKIEHDLNTGDRTTKPLPIKNGYELIIPKETAEDPAMSIVDPIDLGNDTYGAFVFDDKGNAKVMEVKSEVAPMPIKADKKDKAESNEIVYPVSVEFTKDGNKKVFTAVAGEESGNSADLVEIKDKLENSEQKHLLKDKKLRNLAKALFSTAVQDRVAYLTYIS